MAVAIFVVIGLAVSTEDREAFRDERLERAQAPETDGSAPTTTPPPAPGAGGAASGAADRTTERTAGRDESPPSSGSSEQEGTGDRPIGTTAVSVDRAEGTLVRISSAAGAVDVALGGERPVVDLVVPGNEGELMLDPTAGDGPGRVVLTADGRLSDEVSRPVGAGEVAIVGNGRAVELITAGGDRFELAAVGDDPSVIDIARLDGAVRTAVVPGPGGIVDLGDGVTVQLPLPTGDGGGTGSPSPWEQAAAPPWRWVIVAALAIAAVGVLLRLQRPPAGDGQPSGGSAVASGGIPPDRFEGFVAMLAADDDPARAIRLAFYAAERGIGELPARWPAETPFEWCQRAIDRIPHVADPLGSLCNRYATARFAPERPTAADRDAAVADLVDLHRLARRREPSTAAGPGQTTTGSNGAMAGSGR